MECRDDSKKKAHKETQAKSMMILILKIIICFFFKKGESEYLYIYIWFSLSNREKWDKYCNLLLENKLIEWRSCIDSTTPNCPIDGTYTNWSNYGNCVKSETENTEITCGTGKKSRTRTYNAPQYNGNHHSVS
jgi:hypothetical protein